MSLTNLGVLLSGLGRPEDALAAAEEAVAIRRRLVKANRTHTAQPAMSLTNLGMLLSGLGRPQDALAAAEEAVAIYRRLAHTNPAAHQPDSRRRYVCTPGCARRSISTCRKHSPRYRTLSRSSSR